MSVFRTIKLAWPGTVDEARLLDAIRALGVVGGQPIVLEARCQRPGAIRHTVRTLEARSTAVTSQLRSAIPGLGVEGNDSDPIIYTHAVELRFSTKHRTLRLDRLDAVSRAILTSLNRVGGDEVLSLQWWLLQRLPAVPVASTAPISTSSWAGSLLRAPLGPPPTIDSEARSALRQKRSEPGFIAVGRIAVKAASTERANQLVRAVTDALRTAEAPGVHLSVHALCKPNQPPRRGHLRLNVSEIASLSGWPVGRTNEAPVERLGSRRLPATHPIPRSGRVIGLSSWPGKPRPLALSPITDKGSIRR